jgi:hypothetical protein
MGIAASAVALAATWLIAAPRATAAPSGAPALARAQAPEPILRYRFDDGADPTANSGTLGSPQDGDIGGGGQWHFTTAGAGQALSCSSSTEVEPNGSESDFDIADADFSVYARVRASAANGTERCIVSKRDNNGRGYSLALVGSNGRAEFKVRGSSTASVQGTSTLDDGAWHDVLGVRQGNTLTIYVDGMLEGQSPALNLGSSGSRVGS